MGNKQSRYGVITKELKEAIENTFSTKTQRYMGYKIVTRIISEAEKEHGDIFSYVDFSSNYWIKMATEDYLKYKSPLVAAGIIQVKGYYNEAGKFIESYSTEKKQCKSYKINPELLSSELAGVHYMEKDERESAKETIIADTIYEKASLTADFKQLIINESKLNSIIAEQIAAVTHDSFIIDEDIDADFFEVTNNATGFSYHSTKEKSLIKAKEYGLTLIQDENKFFIDDLDRYIEFKKNNIRFSYGSAIKKLTSKYYFAHRNNTNNRLDTNFTNLSKNLMKVIKEDNNLVEIDLANSQFAILAYIMENDINFQVTNDFKTFKEQVAAGTLYEYLQSEFGLATRAEAKVMMMELSFSSWKNNTGRKSKLKELFPSIVEYADNIKKEKGNNQFAIMLQKKESELFIDNVYHTIKQAGMFAITKHDSLLVKKEDAAAVYSFVQDYFNSINFDCKLVAEGLTIEAKEDAYTNAIEAETNPLFIVEENESTEEKEEQDEAYNEFYKQVWQPLDYYVEQHGEELGKMFFEDQDDSIKRYWEKELIAA